jgi:hypothetical protein
LSHLKTEMDIPVPLASEALVPGSDVGSFGVARLPRVQSLIAPTPPAKGISPTVYQTLEGQGMSRERRDRRWAEDANGHRLHGAMYGRQEQIAVRAGVEYIDDPPNRQPSLLFGPAAY